MEERKRSAMGVKTWYFFQMMKTGFSRTGGARAEEYHRDFTEDLPKETLINKDGTDVTEEVYEAYEWLRTNTF